MTSSQCSLVYVLLSRLVLCSEVLFFMAGQIKFIYVMGGTPYSRRAGVLRVFSGVETGDLVFFMDFLGQERIDQAF